MTTLKTVSIKAETFDKLTEYAAQRGLSLADYLEGLASTDLSSSAEKLLAEGKSPLLAFVGVANSEEETDLSDRVREVIEQGIDDYGFRKK